MMDFFYDVSYMIPLDILVTICALSYTGMQEYNLLSCITGAVTIIFIRALRHAGKKERFLIIGIVSAAGAGLFWVLGKEKRAELFAQYGFLIWIILAAVFCIIAGRLTQEYLWAKVIVSVAIIGNDVYLMVAKTDIHSVAVAASFLMLMIYVATLVQKHWEKSGYTDLRKHISLITPVLLIVFILVCITPAPSETFDWTFAKNIWNAIVTEYRRFTGLFAGTAEDYSFTGFSDEGSLGGNVASGYKEVMVIYAGDKSPDKFYLGGISLEDFSENVWDSDLNNGNHFRLFDYLETRAAIIKYTQGYERNFLRENTLKVESRLTNTRNIFLLSKTNLDNRKNAIPQVTETEKSVRADSKIRYGDSYSFEYYNLNYANPELFELIDNAEPLEENEWNLMLKNAQVTDRNRCSYENYQIYRNSIYAKYTETFGMSSELSALVATVTEGAEGDYERVKALSDYLQTMEYNLHPGAIPDTVTNSTEFLDYFMLESKRGNCAHYATALVLLARECGYPARYIQGYCVESNNDSGTVTVTEKSAHAWAEVYFENFGWVEFEATPGYSLYAGWGVSKYEKPVSQTGYSGYNEESETEENVSEDSITDEPRRTIEVKYFLIPAVPALFFGVLYIVINRLITVHNYKKMDAENKIRFMTQRNLRILKLMGYPISVSETIDEYVQRVKNELDEDEALDFMNLYEKLLYSDYVVTENDVTHAEYCYEKLRVKLRKRGLRYRFYIV